MKRLTSPLATWCEIGMEGVCQGRAVHRHHVVLRSRGGTDGPTKDVCAACHEHAHRNRALARERGWIIDSKTGIS